MSTFAFLGALLCMTACGVQDAIGQCVMPQYGAGVALGGRGLGGCSRGAAEPVGAYGGAGTGDLDVAGELPVASTTLVAGQVPILGAVQFAGEVPAAGVVTIAGQCGCDCLGNLLY
ncbi:chorion class A protein Ld2/Ld41-like [Battus philenor]|uniref:chorion class A protein Ld2/Ld41-like n=1 Tax=Battus philenor TaxID=42288 RepID=UPI0035D01BDD